jgi:type IV pilus assembly protein PilA
MKKQVQKGFTLIELMIVVAIVGILAAVALPAYSDYSTRAKVSEAFSVMNSAKAAVGEYYSTQGSFPSDNATALLPANTTYATPTITSVTVSGSGVITTVLKAFGGVTAGMTIILTPTASGSTITWACTGTTTDKYLPSDCTGA